MQLTQFLDRAQLWCFISAEKNYPNDWGTSKVIKIVSFLLYIQVSYDYYLWRWAVIQHWTGLEHIHYSTLSFTYFFFAILSIIKC